MGEVTTWIMLYAIMLMTEFQTDMVVRSDAGLLIIGLVCLYVGVMLLIMLYESVLELKVSGRKLFMKHQDTPFVGKITSACICLKRLCCFCFCCCRNNVKKVSTIM